MDKRLNLRDLILLINKPNRLSCLKLFEKHKDIIEMAPGSLKKHQAWKGGYKDHLEETMNFAIWLYNLMEERRTLPFNLSDALTILFLHDIEKPFKYTSKRVKLETEEQKWLFLKKMIEKYKFKMSEEYWNALKYIHGEGKDFDREKRVQGPLAAFVHICDVVSARIWYDYPEERERVKEFIGMLG